MNYFERCTQLGAKERRIYDYLRSRPNDWVMLSEIVFNTRDKSVDRVDRRREFDATRKTLRRMKGRGLVVTTRRGSARGKLKVRLVLWIPRKLVDLRDEAQAIKRHGRNALVGQRDLLPRQFRK